MSGVGVCMKVIDIGGGLGKSTDFDLSVGESGRAIVSHHSIMVFEAVRFFQFPEPITSLFCRYLLIELLNEDAQADYRNFSACR
nr:arginine decarboxylase-like [Ipomoea trifida]